MGILSWVIVGLIAGFLAKKIFSSGPPLGTLYTILIGVGGGLIGGFLSTLLGIGAGMTGFNIGSIVTATLGALLLLYGYKKLKS